MWNKPFKKFCVAVSVILQNAKPPLTPQYIFLSRSMNWPWLMVSNAFTASVSTSNSWWKRWCVWNAELLSNEKRAMIEATSTRFLCQLPFFARCFLVLGAQNNEEPGFSFSPSGGFEFRLAVEAKDVLCDECLIWYYSMYCILMQLNQRLVES